MERIANNIRQDFIRSVPASAVDDITCFVLYDNHPRDEKRLDITVCTKTGELREYFKRDILSSITMNISSAPTKIILLRNSNFEQFYVVSTNDELFIISTEKSLQIYKIITNVYEFSIEDPNCNGQTYLKVIKKDDAVPIIFDENFKSVEVVVSEEMGPDPLPLVTELRRKYIEAQYNVKMYDNSLNEYKRLRHKATLNAYQNIHPNHGDSYFLSDSKISGALKLKTKPWVKVCNRKFVIALKILNEYKEPLEDVHLLLASVFKSSLSYTTKHFEPSVNTSEMAIEKHDHTLLPNQEAIIVATVDIDEVKMNVTSRITLNGALSYKTAKDTSLLPFGDMVISSIDVLGDEFDALSSKRCDANTLLAILSTTEKTVLKFRNIRGDGQTVFELLIRHLGMEQVRPDVIVYKKSPYHALNGILLHFIGGTDKVTTISVYSRTKSQVLYLIHFINDAVPSKFIITTPNYRLTAKNQELSEFNESKTEFLLKDYSEHAAALKNSTGVLIQYMDMCMEEMSESNDMEISRQVGYKINLYAFGKKCYKEMRAKITEDTDILTNEKRSYR